MESTGLPGSLTESMGRSVGESLAISLLSLGVVCALAYVFLRFLGRRGVGRSNGPIKIVARCPLEPRRALYLIETAGRRFLIGVGDGPMAMLSEIDVDAGADATASERSAAGVTTAPLTGASSSAGSRFADVLARAVGRGGRSRSP